MKLKVLLAMVFILIISMSLNAHLLYSSNDANMTNEGAGDETIVLTNLISATSLDLSMFGKTGYNVTLKISTDNITANFNKETNSYSFIGNGNYISIDFRRDEATLVTGTYNIVPDASAKVGNCIAGYPAMFGDGLWGTFWGTVANDTTSDVAISGGTVNVSIKNGIYTITINAITNEGNVKVSYSGQITIK